MAISFLPFAGWFRSDQNSHTTSLVLYVFKQYGGMTQRRMELFIFVV
jgi:hypothetical protein